jgi:hypothetical protein
MSIIIYELYTDAAYTSLLSSSIYFLLHSVVKINITDQSGVITSPGYPQNMMQGHYEWTFRPTIPRARVALYFEEIDFTRQYGG